MNRQLPRNPALRPPTSLPMTEVEEFQQRSVNFWIAGQRTSIRLDWTTLDALDRIAEEEGLTRHQIAEAVAARRPPDGNLSAALRCFILAYWMRKAAERSGPQDG